MTKCGKKRFPATVLLTENFTKRVHFNSSTPVHLQFIQFIQLYLKILIVMHSKTQLYSYTRLLLSWCKRINKRWLDLTEFVMWVRCHWCGVWRLLAWEWWPSLSVWSCLAGSLVAAGAEEPSTRSSSSPQRWLVWSTCSAKIQLGKTNVMKLV